MITSDTITDEQIRELRTQLERDQLTASFALLSEPHSESLRVERHKARARCAEILEARRVK